MTDAALAAPTGAAPWWRRGWRTLVQPRGDLRHAECERRHRLVLEHMLDLHRDLARVRQSHHEVEVALERCRNWNTSLLRDKDVHGRTVTEVRTMLDRLRQQLEEAARAFTASQAEVQRLSNTLVATETSRDDLENDLKAALDREQALVTQIKDLRAEMRAKRR